MTPLFVVGAPRSGTTLVRHVLRGFPATYLVPDEFQVLPAFVRMVEAGAPARETAAFLDGTAFAGHLRRRGLWPGIGRAAELMQGKAAADALRALVLEIALRDGVDPVTHWGDKTPENVFNLELIARLWPEARVINVVRDPRDTVASMRRAWGRSVLRSAVVWRDAVRAARAFADGGAGGRMHTLSYEGLTHDPERELAALEDWLGLPFDRGVIASVRSEERWGSGAGVTGIRAGAGPSGGDLTGREIRLVEEICLDEMGACGFEPQLARKARQPGRFRLRMVAAGDAARALVAYAGERGWSAAVSYKLRQWRHARRA